MDQGIEEADGLDGLSQTHLVSEDGVGVLRPGEPQPVEPLQLVAMEGATGHGDELRLLLVLLLGLGGWGRGWGE